ncbi:MAG TPA: hypothetical protein PL001_06980, partial [Candidatus Kryptobacter bacterium]|nr:hypothetical protein [Candidatus Kryptobacter bacterium]
LRLSPRWEAAGSDSAEIRCTYEASGSFFEYSYMHERSRKKIEMQMAGKSNVRLHLLLPEGASARSVKVNRRSVRFVNTAVEESHYVDADLKVGGHLVVEVEYRN